jgi:hypothetical protein
MSRDLSAAEVKRVTLAFSKTEDRVSLTCLSDRNAVSVLWLTARLARQLVPHLLSLVVDLPRASWADHENVGDGTQAAFNVKKNDQTEDPSGTTEDKVVNPPVLAEANSASWVVTSIDVTNGPMMVRLCFRNEQGHIPASLYLEHTQVAMWLEGLRRCYVQAGWSMDCWQAPACSEPNRPSTQRVVLH